MRNKNELVNQSDNRPMGIEMQFGWGAVATMANIPLSKGNTKGEEKEDVENGRIRTKIVENKNANQEGEG